MTQTMTPMITVRRRLAGIARIAAIRVTGRFPGLTDPRESLRETAQDKQGDRDYDESGSPNAQSDFTGRFRLAKCQGTGTASAGCGFRGKGADAGSSRERSQTKITGVTMRMCRRLETIPPMTGVASGFMISAPVRVLHMIGKRLATIVATVMTFGRRRSRAPSFTAEMRSA